MALPPRFPGLFPSYGVQIPPLTTLVPFGSPYFMPNPIMAAAAINSQRLASQQIQQPKPPSKPPVTTVFVGNINEKCSNEVIRSLLTECGAVATWKRIQGSNGKFQAFGFCEFESPYGTMRALRILHEYPLAEKKLVVKIDEKTRSMVRDYVAKQRAESGLPVEILASDALPTDEENAADDEEVRQKIRALIEAESASLLPVEDGELDEIQHSPVRNRSVERHRKEHRTTKKHRDRKDGERGELRHRARSRSRSPSRNRHRSRKRSHSGSDRSTMKKSRRISSSSETSSGRSSSCSSSSSSISNASGNRNRKAFRSRSPSRDRDSEDSEEQRERRALRKQIREKEAAYAERLRKWEARERRQAKMYEKDEQREKQRKRDLQKEARKLRHFLEDYDDERMDQKYYKSSSLFQRRRDFEREREADLKDRQREHQEIEELKKQIMAENENIENVEEEAMRRIKEQEESLLQKLRADSGSPNPHHPLGQKSIVDGEDKENEEDSDETGSDSESDVSDEELRKVNSVCEKQSSWRTVDSTSSFAPVEPSSSVGEVGSSGLLSSPYSSPMIRANSSSALPDSSTQTGSIKLNGVFGFEENDDDITYKKGKKLKPFEITDEDRIQSLTPEERKKLIKDLIDRIPTTKDKLFAFPINWNYVDKSLVEQRVKPWVSKKITDYIGEEEASLVDFVCEKVASRADPHKILADIAMVLDDEAEVFVVKMWRLLIYESEAKKLGIAKK